MKKILLFAVIMVAAFSINTLNAQVKGGFKIGVDLSNIRGEMPYGSTFKEAYDSKRLISPRLGFIIEVPVNDYLFFQAGLYGTLKGMRYNDEIEIDNKWYDTKDYQLLIAVDFPINFGYKYDLGGAKIFGMAGPVISYNTYATVLYKPEGKDWDNDKQSVGNTIFDDFKLLNFGVNIEGGVELDRFQFSLFYTQGISNLSNNSIATITTNVFGLAAAIKFGKVDGKRGGFRR